MAMYVNSSGGRGGGRRRSRTMSDINVTPMVDVMLVLLVIFMVTAPLMVTGVQVDLPKTKASGLQGDDRPVTVTVNSDGRVYIHTTEIRVEEMGQKLVAIGQAKPDTRIFVRGDKGIAYGRVMEVMGAINAAGFPKVALVAEMPDTGTSAAPPPADAGSPRSGVRPGKGSR